MVSARKKKNLQNRQHRQLDENLNDFDWQQCKCECFGKWNLEQEANG